MRLGRGGAAGDGVGWQVVVEMAVVVSVIAQVDVALDGWLCWNSLSMSVVGVAAVVVVVDVSTTSNR